MVSLKPSPPPAVDIDDVCQSANQRTTSTSGCARRVRGMRPCARVLRPVQRPAAHRVSEVCSAYRFGRRAKTKSSRRGLSGCTHLGREARARGSHPFHSCTNHGQRYSSEYVSVGVGCNEWVRAQEGVRRRLGSRLTVPDSSRCRRHAEPTFPRRRQQVHLNCRRRS